MSRARISPVAAVLLAVVLVCCAPATAAVKTHKGHQVAGQGHKKKKGPAKLANGVKPVGWTPLTSAAAAKLVHRSSWEPRPQNYAADHKIPGAAELAEWRSQSTMPYAGLVDGRFTGTTDEIIQWAAYKWGLPVELLRAVAAVETWWEQSFVGDDGDSFGIFQVRRPYHCFGECTIVRESTSFTADYYGGIIRSYYDGEETWLNTVAAENGAPYSAGDLWGSVGAWASGRWHNARSEEYVAAVKADLASKPWLQSYFVGQ
ncbi:MAG TPA: hypothetical protein VHV53_11090 [Solirubrobacterales bacterium]|nr:hypothetical protein [Solirubrobacterales bacterium]